MAIASPASVTVSIAADTKGMPSVMLRVKRVEVSAWAGRTFEAAGLSKTSSKVRASCNSIYISLFCRTPLTSFGQNVTIKIIVNRHVVTLLKENEKNTYTESIFCFIIPAILIIRVASLTTHGYFVILSIKEQSFSKRFVSFLINEP